MRKAPLLLDGTTRTAFGAISRLRGARAFHPRGVAFEAQWEPARNGVLPPGAPLADLEHAAMVRLSRAIDLGRPAPDILGVAVKVLDVHGKGSDQDLLMASVGRGLLTGSVLVPRWRFAGTAFSTILPYDLGSQRAAIVAEVHAVGPSTFQDVATAHSLLADVQVFAASGGEIGRVRLGDRLPERVAEEMCFDPWHTGETLRPVGALNRLRRPAYPASQAGRGAGDEPRGPAS